jgi:hypothetical protein
MRMRSVSFRAAAVIVLALVLPSAGLLATQPAMAAAQYCGGNGVFQCVKTTGSGLTLGTLSGWARDLSAGTFTAHEELTGPHGLLRNCSNYTARNGQTGPTCSYSAGRVSAGDYCATTWFLASGQWIEKGHNCVGVHA